MTNKYRDRIGSTFSCLKNIFFITAFIPYAICAFAEELDELELLYGDEETVSVATGSSKALHLAPSIANVITYEDIRALGANSLEDVLRSVPGMHVSLRDRYGSHYSMRGIRTTQAPQILVLMNGYPISEIYSGARIPTQKVPVNNIKRIELIRGPGSAVYGADAFSGVINIITFQNSDIESTRIGLSAGSFDTQGFWLKTKTQFAGWELGLNLEWEQSDGDDERIIASDLQTAFDAAFMTTASNAPLAASTHYQYANSQVQLSKDRWMFTLNTYHQDDTGLGTGIADALDPTGNQYFLQHLLDVKYKGEETASHWRFDVNIDYFYLKQQSDYTIFPAGAVLPIGSDGNLDFVTPAGIVFFPDGYNAIPGGRDKYYSGEVVAFNTAFENHKIRLASGYKKQSVSVYEDLNFGPGVIDGTQPVVDGTLTDITGTPNIFLPDTERTLFYFSAQDEWSLYNDWELTAGIRYDDYNDFGSTVNPRAALVWQTTYNLTSKLLYGKSFRAPSIGELFTVNNPQQIGNADLEPEEIDTLELSLDYRHSYDLKTQFNLFTYKADGLISFIADGSLSGSSVAQNAQDVEGYGFEIETTWNANQNITVVANYAWQNSEVEQTGLDVPHAPQQLAHAELRWKFLNKWSLGTQINYVGDRAREFGDTRQELDNYLLASLTVFSKDLTDHWDFSVAVHNLFDEEAFEPGEFTVPIDHPLSGRRFLINVEFTVP